MPSTAAIVVSPIEKPEEPAALKTPTIEPPNLELPKPKSVKKPELPQLKTPSPEAPMLPSELPRSPLERRVNLIKQEDDMKTPITPPTAYTDFLRALSPALSTPMTAASMRSSFSFTDKSGHLTPTTQPSTAGLDPCDCSKGSRKRSATTAASAPLVPPSPFQRPHYTRTNSGRTTSGLHRLRIPQSPSFSGSPATDSPKSSILRSPFSPTSWYIDGKTHTYEAPRSGVSRPVSIKQVVTRTVTYTHTPITPLDPAPKGKRRKVE